MINQEKFKRYLLGDLPEKEKMEIDLLVIADDSVSEHLFFAESELIEDYLEGSLSQSSLLLFYDNFCSSPQRLKQLSEIKILKEYARNSGVQKKRPDVASRLIDLVNNFFLSLSRPNLIGAGFIALLVIIGFLSFAYFYNSVSNIEREYTVLNKADLSDQSIVGGLSTINLVPGVLRGEGVTSKQNRTDLTEQVYFRLASRQTFDDGIPNKFTLYRADKLVFTIDGLRAYQNPNGVEIRVLLPKSILETGLYKVKVNKETGPEIGSYLFVID